MYKQCQWEQKSGNVCKKKIVERSLTEVWKCRECNLIQQVQALAFLKMQLVLKCNIAWQCKYEYLTVTS